MKKKIGLSIVTFAALATPIATIVSCGKQETKVIKPKKQVKHETKKPEAKKPETKKPETKKPEAKKPKAKKPKAKKPTPETLDAETIKDIKLLKDQKEGLWLTKNAYHDGVLWDIKDDKTKQVQGFNSGIVEFGKGDSFYVKYNEDDNDGFAPSTFTKNLFFKDSSIADNPIINNENLKMGHKSSNLLSFEYNGLLQKEGHLQAWVGSQTNHLTDVDFNSALFTIYKKYQNNEISEKAYNAICSYYGVKPNPKNGKFEDDTTITLHASRIFKPVFQGDKYFTFKRVTPRIFKITFNDQPNTTTTSAGWAFKSTNGSNRTNGQTLGNRWSLGTSMEWDFYEKRFGATQTDWFNARKNQYIKPKPKKPTVNTKPSQDIYSLDGSRTDKTDGSGNPINNEGKGILQQQDYDNIHNVLVKKPGKQIAFVVIANHHFYTEIVDIVNDHTKTVDIMDGLKRFMFRYYMHPQFGRWVKTFKFKKTTTRPESSQWLHGTSTSTNYNDYYMMWFKNHVEASLGISNDSVNDNDIMEITYDHNS